MLRSWRLGKLFAIPLYLHPSFLLVPFLVLLQNPGGSLTQLFLLVLVLAVFGCVLLHELGHALMARYFGIGTRDITLYPIGGVARLNRMSDDPWEEMAIALAGPAVNVLIAALLTPLVALAFWTGAAHESALLGLGVSLLRGLWLSNLILAAFNMIPAFPMDGGRVLRAVLSLGLGQLQATEVAVRVGVVLAVLLGIAGLWFNGMLVLVAGFVILAALQELFLARQRARLTRPQPLEHPPVDVLDPEHPAGEKDQPAAPEREPGFSGSTWQPTYQVWVKRRNGSAGSPFWEGLH